MRNLSTIFGFLFLCVFLFFCFGETDNRRQRQQGRQAVGIAITCLPEQSMASPAVKKATRKQRLKVVANDFQASAEEHASDSRLQLKADTDLFVVDTEASSARRKRKLEPKGKVKVEATKLFKKALKSDAFKLKRPRTRKLPGEGVADIWDAPAAANAADNQIENADASAQAAVRLAGKARATPKHAKPLACHPGLSYNPQTKDHQDIVAAAVAVELSRNEAKAEKDELWSRAMAAKAAAPEEPISDEESEDEEEGDREVVKRVNRGKLTRAERNRQARHRQSLMLQRQAKRNKTMLNQIKGVNHLVKVLKSEERDSAAKPKKDISTDMSLEQMMGRKAQSAPALMHAKAIPAPLSDELAGSLRCLKTKSSVLLEQLNAKQFAVDPQLKVKKALRAGPAKKRKLSTKFKVKSRPRYFTE